jgi:maltooligosyltrehalose synthase
MNKHRFLVDADGNTTSWDRYMWIGTFGGVPILFEPAWEECWHGSLVNGDNCIVADRATLGEVLERLRSDTALARHIAAGAAKLVATQLSPAGAQEMFETAWRTRCLQAGAQTSSHLQPSSLE